MLRTSGLIVAVMYFMCFAKNVHSCDVSSGPVGEVVCVDIVPDVYLNYAGYQWGICLTNAYIKQWSSNKYHCEYDNVYCDFQCMLGSHNLLSGDVANYPDCSCQPGQELPSSILLDAVCYSPDGSDCSWYVNCLKMKYNTCTGQEDYAIEYGYKFCNLYSDNFAEFSLEGQQWINAVKKCLQVSLVPSIWPWSQDTCADIKNLAFKTHPACYLAPYNGQTVCALPFSDYLKIFMTIKGSLVSDFQATLTQFFQVGITCVGGWISMYARYLTIELKLDLHRQKREAVSDLFSEFGYNATNQIASQLNWDRDGMFYYSYVQNATLNELSVFLLLADKVKLDLTTTVPDTYVGIESTINNFKAAVSSGKLSVSIPGYQIDVTSLASCTAMSNTTCSNSQTIAAAPVETSSATSSATNSATTSILQTTYTTTTLRNTGKPNSQYCIKSNLLCICAFNIFVIYCHILARNSKIFD